MPDVIESTNPEFTTATDAPGPEQAIALDIDLASQQRIGELLERYGEIVRVPSPKRPADTFLIVDPDAVRHVLVSHHEKYRKGTGFERVQMLLGNGIIVSDGDFWRRQRRMIQPAFSRRHILRMTTMIETLTRRLIPRWRDRAATGEAIDITRATSEFSLEVILRALIGDDLDRLTGEQGHNPFAFLADDSTRDLALAMRFRQLTPLIQGLIDRRRTGNETRDDLLDALMTATDKRGQAMSDKEVIDEVMTMIIAGHETTAGTLNWLWYELARHPEVEARLLDEARGHVIDDRLDGEATGELHYCRQVIDETLRLYPPVWLFTRKAIEDDVVAGFSVPAGSDLFLSPFFTHRLSRLWPDPERFDPARFAGQPPHKYAFIPFSAGSRRCIGEYFSYIEMKIHLAILIRHFKLRLLPGQTIELDPGINLRTRHPIRMSVAIR